MMNNIITRRFDSAETLDSNEMIIEYLNLAKEDTDDYFLEALTNVIRAKAVEALAKEIGSSRKDLFKVLTSHSIQSPETVNKILKALDVDFTYTPKQEQENVHFYEENSSFSACLA